MSAGGLFDDSMSSDVGFRGLDDVVDGPQCTVCDLPIGRSPRAGVSEVVAFVVFRVLLVHEVVVKFDAPSASLSCLE